MEETELRFKQRMNELEIMAAQGENISSDTNQEGRMQHSAETIKTYIKNFNHNDKLDFI
jgi:hypothetical protein